MSDTKNKKKSSGSAKKQPVETHYRNTSARDTNQALFMTNNSSLQFNTFEKLLKSLPSEQDADPEFIIQPELHSRALSQLLNTQHSQYHLPAIHPTKNLTLVLDLDETLIHYEEIDYGKGKIHVRPYVDRFLRELSNYYEIVVFTASVKEYADEIIDQIDEDNWVSHRLYREHTTFFNSVYFKDLRRLGRELSKTIIVDNNSDNFSLQPRNGIAIESFTGDHSDITLIKMMNILVSVAEQYTEDVRHHLVDHQN